LNRGAILIIAVAGACVAAAQQAEGPQTRPPAPQPPGTLKIIVVEGEGAKNSIRSRSATAPVVQVIDEAEKPVAGAEVVIQLPLAGPGAVFHGWLKTQTIRTDAKGQAAATGFAPNDEEGRFNIKVTATAGNRTGSAVIAQSNVRGTGGASMTSGRSGWWKVLAVAGGAAAAGIVVAAASGNGAAAPAATTPVTITTGPITVGGPR